MFDLRPVERPYPGLRPFEAHEAEIFFGRDRHTDRLLDILQRERFLAVIGPSGGGKSSLVRAGLLPALAGGRLGTGSHWRLALLRPGAQPVLALAQALTSPHALGVELAVPVPERLADAPPAPLAAATADDATADAALIAAELRRGPGGFDRLLAQAQARRQTAGGSLPTLNLLVLADQFEELFTYRAAAVDPDEAGDFVDLLLHACRSGDGPRPEPPAGGIRVVVALTMRTDFLGQCTAFADLPEAINRAQYLTPRLRNDELLAAVVGPARLFGGDVAAGFAEATVADASRQADELPLLQHALARWWTESVRTAPNLPLIDANCAAQAGQVSEALNLHAEWLFADMTPSQQRTCEELFRAITAGRDGADAVRRPQRLADIAAWSGIDEPQLAEVVRVLAAPEVSFLHHGPVLGADSVIDLSHEALMRQWLRLRNWVADELRRAQGLRRWRVRAAEHADNQGSLLTGADLARALDWWNPSAGSTAGRWEPTAAWTQRYADAARDPTDVDGDLVRLRRFLEASREEAGRVADLVRQQAQLEVQRIEQARGARRVKIVSAGWLLIAGVLTAIAVQQGNEARTQSNFAKQQAIYAVNAFEAASTAAVAASAAAGQASDRLRAVSLLTDYWAGFGDPARLDEALAADAAIREILARAKPDDTARRRQIPLEIWAKDIDQDSVRAALSKLGFPVMIRKANLSSDATNAVWAGTPVPADDTRLVALGMMRAGIAVRSIGPIQEWVSGRDRAVLQAGATRDSTNCRPFTVAEVMAAAEFTRAARHHCP